MSDERDRAGAGEGPDADSDGTIRDEDPNGPPPKGGDTTKTQDLTGAAEEGFDPNTGQE